jgi:hypothetical protein
MSSCVFSEEQMTDEPQYGAAHHGFNPESVKLGATGVNMVILRQSAPDACSQQ